MMSKKEPITSFDQKRQATCLGQEELLVTCLDLRRPPATCFDPEGQQWV